MTRFFCLIFLLLNTLLLAACVSPYVPPPPPRSTPAGIKLAEAAVNASKTLNTLEAIRKAENPDFKKRLPSIKTRNMSQEVSVDWTGPIEPVVKHMAKISGYRFRVLGTVPAIPVIVSLHERDVSVAYVMRNIDYQAGTKAFIIVYPSRRIVELRYPSA
ncbi:MAG: type IVB secretion system lipoprotein DotD [Pseudomonadota bacterium]